MFISIAVQSEFTITVPTEHFYINCWLSSNKSVTLEFSAEIQIFFIYIYIIFHKLSSGCSPVLPCGQEDAQTHLTKLTVDFPRHSNYWCILSVSCNTHMTHRMFCPQQPSAVPSAHSSNSHKATRWPHCAGWVKILYPLKLPLPEHILCYAVHLIL